MVTPRPPTPEGLIGDLTSYEVSTRGPAHPLSGSLVWRERHSARAGEITGKSETETEYMARHPERQNQICHGGGNGLSSRGRMVQMEAGGRRPERLQERCGADRRATRTDVCVNETR
jgi:hypothetical protein